VKFLFQFLIILFFYFLGEAISYLLPFSFPGAVIGMLLLFISLNFGLVKVQDIKLISNFFLKYMALFFIPAGVSIMASYHLIQEHLISISFVLILSTLFMLAFISLLVDKLIHKTKDV